jgi:hypothetical protein
VGVIIQGAPYRQNWSGIPFTQPGGPGTQVFPAEQINVPWGPPNGYPVVGQVFSESSGLWSPGCGHWINAAMIFQDGNGFVGQLTYLQDNLGRNWRISVYDNGQGILAIPVSYQVNLSTVLLQDTVLSQNWQMSLIANGSGVDIVITPVGGTGQSQLLVGSPNGSLYGIQVAGGILEVAFPLANYGTALAIITCEICTFCQYTIPLSQFNNPFAFPVVII